MFPRLNFSAVQEDLRKVGIAVIIAALAALFFGSASKTHAIYIVLFGLFIWLFGILEFKGKEEEND